MGNKQAYQYTYITYLCTDIQQHNQTQNKTIKLMNAITKYANIM